LVSEVILTTLCVVTRHKYLLYESSQSGITGKTKHKEGRIVISKVSVVHSDLNPIDILLI